MKTKRTLPIHRYLKPASAAALATAIAYVCLAHAGGIAGILATAALCVLAGLALASKGRPLRGRSVHAPAVQAEPISRLSHEIRTPLNGILGLTQVLLEMKPGTDQRELLDLIKGSGESLLRLLNDLLDYSQIHAGKIRFDLEEFPIRRWLRQTVMMHAPQAHRKGLEIAYWVARDVPEMVVSDPHRLRQVLSNLIVNAVKFTERGEVLVEVSSIGGRRVRFSVRDTGSGISEAGRARIFEPFIQGENATSERGGLGLGLAISSEIVERMGGSIEVESTVGEGSTLWFEVELPGSRSVEDELEGAFRGMTALVVDDSPAQRDVIARALRLLGVAAETASNREEALGALEASLAAGPPVSFVFLDSRIPGVDSLALAREAAARGKVPVVLLAFTHERWDIEELRAHGILGQLAKPVAPTHLFRTIEILRRGASVERPEDVQTQGMERPLVAGLRVLVADDHPVNRTVVVRLLGNLGSEVTVAANGREALELHEKEWFDLLLLDIEMPEVDGLTVARKIRERERGTPRHLPVVALTAHARDDDRERCFEAGVDGFVGKPFTESELVSALSSALRGSGRTAAKAPAVFDREEALRRANGDEALLAELTGLFLQETPETLKAIATAVEEEDILGLERLAHRLKGALLTLSAHRAARAALELEASARTGGVDAARAASVGLRLEVDALEAELRIVPRHEPELFLRSAGDDDRAR
jgi:CheY-like chemotaxis protein/nitrogen-specific signal transduction histidine kinase/HPt (histidine-containing phosphotransfer) domain-containing protein